MFANGLTYANDIYVSSVYFGNGRIWKIDSSGSLSVITDPGFFAGGLTLDSKGNLYVGNDTSHTIEKFGPSGQRSVFASWPNINFQAMVFDSSGNLYAANNVNSVVVKFDPTGQGSVFASGLHDPIGLTFDSSGNLYVANEDSHYIEMFDPSGNGTVVASTGSYFPLFVAAKPIPEPMTWAMVAMGIAALFVGHRLRSYRLGDQVARCAARGAGKRAASETKDNFHPPLCPNRD